MKRSDLNRGAWIAVLAFGLALVVAGVALWIEAPELAFLTLILAGGGGYIALEAAWYLLFEQKRERT